MRKTMMAAVAAAALMAAPSMSFADPNAAGGAATGAAVGAGAGFLVGGPIGAAVGAGVGGIAGAGASDPARDDRTVVIERDRPTTERNCVRDSRGNTACEEIRR